MNYEIIDLPQIAIIGKEGLCTKEKNAVQDLWQQANSNFSEIAEKLEHQADFRLYLYAGFGHAAYDNAPDYRERLLRFFCGQLS